MSYLQTYRALTDLGAPIAHLGRTPLTFYADHRATKLHGDPTCVKGSSPLPMRTTLDELADSPTKLCETCGRAVIATTVGQLVDIGIRHIELATTATLTAEVRAALPTWNADTNSAIRLLDGCLRLIRSSATVTDLVALCRPGRLDPALLDWMTRLTDDAAAALTAAAAELRADMHRTSALTGVPLGGPARWVLMERVAYLLQGAFIGTDQHLTLVAFWPRVGTTPAHVTAGQQLLVAVPEQLAERLTNPSPGAQALAAGRLPVHIDAGPAAPTDDPSLPWLALRLMTNARPTDPLWEPSAAVIAARGVLVAA